MDLLRWNQVMDLEFPKNSYNLTHSLPVTREGARNAPAPVGFEDLSQKGSSLLYGFSPNKILACTCILKGVVWHHKPETN